MRRFLAWIALVTGILAAAFWLVTMPRRIDAASLPPPASLSAARGERLFWTGGCASCHAAKGAKNAARLLLGGRALVTPLGVFQAPNISPDRQHGIGDWSLGDFANAMQRGIGREGEHLYPAFPYTSYARMTPADIGDLYVYLASLPPVSVASPETQLDFPLNIRRGIGLWKLLFMGDAAPFVPVPAENRQAIAGRYLVEGPGHCGQCHTPRSLSGLGGLDRGHWLAGAPNPDGKGRVPNITATPAGIGSWSAADIANYLETGFTPDYDSVGGSMVEVQENMARLPKADRLAMAAYLKLLQSPGTATGNKP